MIRPWEIHPAFVHFPIAFLTGAVAVDVYALARGRPELHRWGTGLLVTGAATLFPTAAAGLLAYFTVPAHTEEAHTLMLWHLGLNVCALFLWTGLALYRWRARPALPGGGVVALGALFLAATLFSSYLGGEIVYKGGAGIEPSILSPELQHSHEHGAGHEHAQGAAHDHDHEHAPAQGAPRAP